MPLILSAVEHASSRTIFNDTKNNVLDRCRSDIFTQYSKTIAFAQSTASPVVF
ncbi:MAG: hypothetical protein LBT89_02125 [Planctomycetaceae bacterium]|nr:hypothetical protein [Planctomycetaceae bacterium]